MYTPVDVLVPASSTGNLFTWTKAAWNTKFCRGMRKCRQILPSCFEPISDITQSRCHLKTAWWPLEERPIMKLHVGGHLAALKIEKLTLQSGQEQKHPFTLPSGPCKPRPCAKELTTCTVPLMGQKASWLCTSTQHLTLQKVVISKTWMQKAVPRFVVAQGGLQAYSPPGEL